jgi:hypothetical protein
MGTVEAFRPLFDEHPELTGRPLNNSSPFNYKEGDQSDPNDDWWERLERMAVLLYSQGITHHEIWSRAGGDLSVVSLNVSGKAAWHAALKSLRLGGGGRRIDRLTLVSEMLEDYPDNADLKALRHSSG